MMLDPEKAKEKNTEACMRMHNLIREISEKPIIDPCKRGPAYATPMYNLIREISEKPIIDPYKRGPAYVPPKPSSLNKMWMKIKSFMDRIQIKGKK